MTTERTYTNITRDTSSLFNAITVSKRPKLRASALSVDPEVVDPLDEGRRECRQPETNGCGEGEKRSDGEVERETRPSVYGNSSDVGHGAKCGVVANSQVTVSLESNGE